MKTNTRASVCQALHKFSARGEPHKTRRSGGHLWCASFPIRSSTYATRLLIIVPRRNIARFCTRFSSSACVIIVRISRNRCHLDLALWLAGILAAR